MALGRTHERRRDRVDAAETRVMNKGRKANERVRRDKRMGEILRAGSFPYSPAVMSWLSRKLDKKASRITPEDIKALQS